MRLSPRTTTFIFFSTVLLVAACATGGGDEPDEDDGGSGGMDGTGGMVGRGWHEHQQHQQQRKLRTNVQHRCDQQQFGIQRCPSSSVASSSNSSASVTNSASSVSALASSGTGLPGACHDVQRVHRSEQPVLPGRLQHPAAPTPASRALVSSLVRFKAPSPVAQSSVSTASPGACASSRPGRSASASGGRLGRHWALTPSAPSTSPQLHSFVARSTGLLVDAAKFDSWPARHRCAAHS